MTKKYLFDRETALKVCYEYYQGKGYSREHCDGYFGRTDDANLKRIYEIICREQENEANSYIL